MLASPAFEVFVLHAIQFTLVIGIVAVVSTLTSRRWPHLTFLLMMLALVKCVCPPIIASPSGVFSWSRGVSVQSRQLSLEAAKLQSIKSNLEIDRASVGNYFDITPAKSASTSEFLLGLWNYAGPTTLLVIWLGVAFVLFVRSVWQLRKLTGYLLARTHTPSVALIKTVRDLKTKFGVRRPIRVVVSEGNVGPGCIGFFRPTMVIPKSMAENMPPRYLNPVLAHELTHIRRGDIYWGYLQYLVQIVWWFHPLVWWLDRRANLMCERCVDEQVLATGHFTPAEYAESLVHVLQHKQTLRLAPLVRRLSAAEVTTERLAQLKSRGGRFERQTCGMTWGVVALVACLALPGMNWRPASSQLAHSAVLADCRDELLACLEADELRMAEAILQEVLAAETSSGVPRSLLGCLQASQGRLHEALENQKVAAGYWEVRAMALFNCGRICAQLSLKDEAIGYLLKAKQFGFVSTHDLSSDPAFEAIRDERLFAALSPHFEPPRPLQTDESGVWMSSGELGEMAEQKCATKSPDGQLLVPEWSISEALHDEGPEVSFWLDALGNVTELRGVFVEDKFQSVAARFSPGGGRTMQRRTLVKTDEAGLLQTVEHSMDRGNHWTKIFEVEYDSQGTVRTLTQLPKSERSKTKNSISRTALSRGSGEE